jgi:hypothetical protein
MKMFKTTFDANSRPRLGKLAIHKVRRPRKNAVREK